MAGDARVSNRDSDRDTRAPRAERPGVGTPRVTETRSPGDAPVARTAPDHATDRTPDRAEPHEAQRSEDGPESAPALGRNPEVEESPLPPHEPGSMDITYHEETYQAFIRWTIRTVLAILAVLILLALFNA